MRQFCALNQHSKSLLPVVGAQPMSFTLLTPPSVHLSPASLCLSYTTFRILRQKSSNILCNLRKDTFQSLKKTIVSAIMATDMISHFAEVRRGVGRWGTLTWAYDMTKRQHGTPVFQS